jgi:hypothetical protein
MDKRLIELDAAGDAPEKVMRFLIGAANAMGSNMIHTVVAESGETEASHDHKYEELRTQIDEYAKSVDGKLDGVFPQNVPLGVIVLSVLQVCIKAMTVYVQQAEKAGRSSCLDPHCDEHHGGLEDELLKSIQDAANTGMMVDYRKGKKNEH